LIRRRKSAQKINILWFEDERSYFDFCVGRLILPQPKVVQRHLKGISKAFSGVGLVRH
jgi:hypothetical protein